MRIVFENTVYSLFIYMLIDETWKERTYIIDKKLENKLNISHFQNKFFYEFYNIKKNFFIFYFQKIKFIFLFLKLGIYQKKQVELYGDTHMIDAFFINKPFFMIEDGSATYKIKPQNKSFLYKLRKLIKLENIFYDLSQTSNFVKKIYLTGLAPIPEEIKDKVEIINIKELWSLKTEEEKEEILAVFNFDRNILDEIKEKNIILFTQPLSEDNLITEDEKISLYRSVLKYIDLNKLIIKTHPRERTNYREIFSGALVLDNVFPSEFFMLFDIKFEKAITLFSTAVLNFKNIKEIDFYGTEVHPNLLKAFGSLDNVYKRNKFLDESDVDE